MRQNSNIVQILLAVSLQLALTPALCQSIENPDVSPIVLSDTGQVNIPDTAFLYALIDAGVDTNEDSLISYEEAEDIKSLDVSGGPVVLWWCEWVSSISCLTGIEAFKNLDTLQCFCAKIDTIDLSGNLKLKYLNCSRNQLTNLDVSNNTALTELDCSRNQLTNLDVSNNNALTVLDCGDNQLTNLDVSNNTALTELDCYWNQLTNLDVSNNNALTVLNCNGNQLTSLDVSNNPALLELNLSSTQLSSLDVSNNPALLELNCEGSRLTSLDVSNSPDLRYINLSFIRTLSGVCVWTWPFPPPDVIVDISYSPSLYFTGECSGFNVYIPDTSFLYALIEAGVDTDGDSLISHFEANKISGLNISGYGITDLTGIHAFNNLDTLICSNNAINSLHLLISSGLRYLDCSNNEISVIDLNNNRSLLHLDCSNNEISVIEVNNNPSLSYLNCSNSQIIELDISGNASLEALDIRNISTLYEVCVGTVPFPTTGLTIDTTASPNIYFTTLCDCDGDQFEYNDFQYYASLLHVDALYEDLFVSRIDDDWFQLIPGGDILTDTISITIILSSPAGDIHMDFTDTKGVVKASAHGDTVLEISSYPVRSSETHFLHIYLDSGTVSPYSLQWSYTLSSQNSELNISRSDADCDHCIINPFHIETPYVLDTMIADLLSGEIFEETISIRNNGPGSYYFYSVLDCSEQINNQNQSILFDGVDGSIGINVTDYLNFYDHITLEAWIRTAQEDEGVSPIISKGIDGNEYELFISGEANDRRLGFRTGGDTIYSTSVLESGRWYHVAASRNNHIIRLYLNGILDHLISSKETTSNENCALFIGSNDPRNEIRHYFKGIIDEIRIWNTVREAWEIHAFMHRTLYGDETGLAGYWPMNGELPNVVVDYASQSYGVLQGGASRISSSIPIVDMIRCPSDLGMVQSGFEEEFKIQFNSIKVKGGDYYADIQLISHNPYIPDLILPVKLHVTDAPSFSIKPDSLNLGELVIFATNTIELEVANQGSQMLYVDSVRTIVTGSKITPANVAIEPGGSQTFKVDVVRRTLDHFSGDITFYTNDPNNPQVIVPLSGEGAKIVRSPLLHQIVDTIIIGNTKFYYKLFINESATYGMTLKPTITTFTLQDEIYDRMFRPESEPGEWISTSLYPTSFLEPKDSTLIKITLDASRLEFGDYFADVALEWYNPEYHKAFIPVQLHVRFPVHVEIVEGNENDLILFPNPVKDILTVQLKEPIEFKLEIISMNGQVILQREYYGSSQSFDLSSFRTGVYFITIRSKEFVTTSKIVKL